MRNKIIIMLALAAVGAACWLGVACYDAHTISRGMPPGYYLECDNAGRYRPCRLGSPLFWTRGPGTKPEAMRRAWRQYEYEAEKYGGNWQRCE